MGARPREGDQAWGPCKDPKCPWHKRVEWHPRRVLEVLHQHPIGHGTTVELRPLPGPGETFTRGEKS